jgi:hypothetical protein
MWNGVAGSVLVPSFSNPHTLYDGLQAKAVRSEVANDYIYVDYVSI